MGLVRCTSGAMQRCLDGVSAGRAAAVVDTPRIKIGQLHPEHCRSQRQG